MKMKLGILLMSLMTVLAVAADGPVLTYLPGKAAETIRTNKGVWKNVGGSQRMVRHLDLFVNDKRFADQSVLVMEIRYTAAARGQWVVKFRQPDGVGETRRSFGKTNTERTLRIELRNVVMPAEDWMFQIHRKGRDVRVTSITIRGYDRRNPANIGKLVQIVKAANPVDMVFMYPRRVPARITYEFHNSMAVDVPIDCRFSVAGTDINAAKQEVLAAGKSTTVEFGFTPKDLLLGHYVAKLTVGSGGRDFLTRETRFGVITPTDIPKAAKGEFMYGLDVSLWIAAADERLLRFTELMGVDIVRGGFSAWAPRHEHFRRDVEKYVPLYRRYKLKNCYNMGPADSRFGDNQEAIIQKQIKHLEWVAREYKDQFPYYELGNEPDLPFFYRGKIETYAADFKRLRAAIKRGNPDAIVMNGGWAYGVEKIRRFYDVLKPEDVDAIAYHAHGKGSVTERRVYRRTEALVHEFGFQGKPLIDTESGLMAKTAAQEIFQARTAIQKIVYVQSKGAPFFLWFRLWMGNREYGCTWNVTEPRPAVLTYRNLVETLRGHRWVQTLVMQDDNAEGYVFRDGNRSRVCVLWLNDRGRHQASLHLGDVKNARLIDMYGNQRPAPVQPGGIAVVRLSEDPVFLKWDAVDGDHAVSVHPGIVQSLPVLALLENTDNRVLVRVANPTAKATAVTLSVTARSDTPLTVKPATTAIELAAGDTREIALTATTGAVRRGIRWPGKWTVFTHTRPGLDLAAIDAVPATLPGAAGTAVDSSAEVPINHTIDLARLGNYVRKKNTKANAVVIGEIHSTADRTVRMGAGADFWMEWYLNGKPVYDTLAKGNGAGYTMFDHMFDLPLKQGKNLLVGRVLAGSHGWRLVLGSPMEIAKAMGDGPQDLLQLTLTADNGTRVTEEIGVEFRQPVPKAPAAPMTGPLASWEKQVPTAVLSDKNVENLFFRHPNAGRWWQGYADLSATAWLAADKDLLYLVVKAIDDKHRPATKEEDLAEADSLCIGIAQNGKANVYRIGAVGKNSAVVKTGTALTRGDDNIKATVRRTEGDTGNFTVYRVAIPRRLFGDGQFFVNFYVNDNDEGYRKQYIQWKPGLEGKPTPASWYRAQFRRQNY